MLQEPFRHTPLSPPEIRVRLAVHTAVVIALTVVVSVDFVWLVLYANMPAAMELPARVAAVTILGLTVATIGITSVTVGAVIVGPISTTIASVTGVMMVVAWMVTTIRDLRAARAEIARLAAVEAVAEERLRFACDLHDLRGAADNVRNATRCGTPGHRDAGYGRLEAASALHAQLPRRASG